MDCLGGLTPPAQEAEDQSMNPLQLVLVLACVFAVLAAFFAFEIAIFRASCRLSGLPKPHLVRAAVVVSVLLSVPGVIDAVVYGLLDRAYRASDYPLWEAKLVQFALALPVHMAICSAIHARMLGVRLADAVSVWLVEKFLKLLIVLGLAAVAAVALLSR